jgi:capsular polysaccharide biosynthesis protein
MTFVDALKIFNRYKWIIIAAVLLSGAFGYFWSARQDKVYQASITLVIGQNQGIAENLNFTTALQNVANSMSKMITSTTVAEKVVGDYDLELSPDTVLGGLSAEPIQQTQLIIVTFTSTDPEQAALVANGVGNSFAELISRTESSRSGLTAQVWQSAKVPGEPVSPNPVRTGLLAAFLGLLAGIGIALVLDRLDTRWRSLQEVEEKLGLPVLGVIPRMTEESLSESNKY